jgi:hypothetical protein
MKVEQKLWHVSHGWKDVSHADLRNSAQLVIAFGSRQVLSDPKRYYELKEHYPHAHILTCTTSGEILGSKILDDTVVCTAILFEKTHVKVEVMEVGKINESYRVGYDLAQRLSDDDDLSHIFVLSDGSKVAGSELVRGLNHAIKKHIPITGGLAGDGTLFQKTLVGLNAPPTEGQVVVVGFYGKSLKIGHGSKGGWDAFGPERIVTRSEGNVLYELDNKSALQLYKQYLGPLAKELPGSALLFPLALTSPDSEETVVRAILATNEEEQKMVFAGDIPVNSKVRLMRANFDRLIDGAVTAANNSLTALGSFDPQVAILISCVGRRVVLNHRTEEEVEETTRILGKKTPVSGFYSYGEISPVVESTTCELHNQTMTITVYRED